MRFIARCLFLRVDVWFLWWVSAFCIACVFCTGVRFRLWVLVFSDGSVHALAFGMSFLVWVSVPIGNPCFQLTVGTTVVAAVFRNAHTLNTVIFLNVLSPAAWCNG